MGIFELSDLRYNRSILYNLFSSGTFTIDKTDLSEFDDIKQFLKLFRFEFEHNICPS